jgi:hypothetical protein
MLLRGRAHALAPRAPIWASGYPPRVRRQWIARACAAVALGSATAGGAARAEAGCADLAARAGLQLPPGTRAGAAGQRVSGRGLRDTTDHLARQLAARGIAARQLGPYRVRGVEIARLLSESPATPWLAIHVVRVAGQTTICFVPRAEA